MRLSLSHPPESRRLLVAGSVRWIIGGFYFREPLHADGVDLRDPVFERGALNLIFDLAMPQDAFKGDELPLLESFGELREIPPGIDAVPFGAVFVVALVVLPSPHRPLIPIVWEALVFSITHCADNILSVSA